MSHHRHVHSDEGPVGRPVLALDFDGVLNAFDPPADAGWEPHVVHAPAATLPKSPFIRGGGAEDLDVTVHLHPRHGVWINRLLAEGVDVVWITSWEEAANAHISPLLGVPALTVVSLTPTRAGYAFSGDAASAKLDRLRAEFGTRCVVWIDDMASWKILGGGRWLQIETDPGRGLTEADQASAEAYLGWARAAAPDELFRTDFEYADLHGEGTWSVTTADGHRVTVTHPRWEDTDDVLELRAVWEAPGSPPQRLDADFLSWRRPFLTVGESLLLPLSAVDGPGQLALGTITSIRRLQPSPS